MCNCKIISAKKSSKNIRLVQSLTKEGLSNNYIQRAKSQTKKRSSPPPSTEKVDMFQLYSTRGVANYELEVFGVPAHQDQDQQDAGAGNNNDGRKTRVSTEVHPMLVFEQLFPEEAGAGANE